ncbi:MAG: pyrroline-5-carboxylate reductase [Actinobacteria bacterium]|nr:pyrroline-5-carboxylate reductase [Actinomycetota bacterium]
MAETYAYSIGIIGSGVMGEALLATILKAGVVNKRVVISDKRLERTTELAVKYGCDVGLPEEISLKAENIFLVVKPQDLDALMKLIGSKVSTNQRLVSFIAGKKTSHIQSFLLNSVPVLRVMPNTPVSVGVGALAISKGNSASEGDIKAIEEFLKASGKTICVEEKLQDAVTATSGSGPAYFFRFVEAMISAAEDLGLTTSDARTLVIQTISGAAEMLKQEGASPKVLRENVTSPNGTTFAALEVFEREDLVGVVKRAMLAARNRSQELS